jgi:hypothetical protein
LALRSVRFAAFRRRRTVSKTLLKKLAALGALVALLLVKKAAKLRGRDTLDTKAHATEEDVRRAIDGYLWGRLALEELDTWLTTRTWDNDNAREIAHRAALLIAEAARGDRDDIADELRALASRAGGRQTVA